MPKPSVFVIGAGVAGLSCARVLDDAGFLVRIGDKGRGPGGRCSSRRSPAGRFDHGAASFTVEHPSFQVAVDRWCEAGVAAPWAARLLKGGEAYEPEAPHYLGVRAMNQIIKHDADHLGAEFELELGQLGERLGSRFELSTKSGHQIADADFVVVATPAPQAAALLPANSPLKARAEGVVMAPCWTLMDAFPEGVGDPGFDAHLAPSDHVYAVFWQNSRPGREGLPRFVLQASSSWSTDHLEDDADAVGSALISELMSIMPGLPAPELTMVHRWRYARVEETAAGDYGLDLESGFATCGDWHIGPNIEDAWLSGHRLGQALVAQL